MSDSSFGTNLVVAWTGHRDLDHTETLAKAVRLLIEHLKSASNDRLLGVGSLAIGADTLVAEALIECRVPLLAVLPFELERFELEAPTELRNRVLRLATVARSVRYVSPQANDDEAYFSTSELMLEHADVLVAIIDPEREATAVGAHAVAELARDRGIHVLTIDARTGAFEFTLPVKNPPLPPTRTRADVVRLFEGFDAGATNASRPVRSILFWIIVLHLAASAVAVAQLVFDAAIDGHLDGYVAAVIKLGGLIGAVVLALWGQAKHHAWTECRVSAEVCRSFLALWDMPRNTLMLPPAPTVQTRQLRRELELAWLCDVPSQLDIELVKASYVAKVPPDPIDRANPNGRVTEQIEYFAKNHRRASGLAETLHHAATASTVVAIVAGAVALALALLHAEGGLYLTTKAASLCLPLGSAAMLSYVTSLDLGRRTSRYLEMEAKCRESLQRCKAAKSWHSLGRAVSELEWLFVAEVGEWHAFNRHAGGLH